MKRILPLCLFLLSLPSLAHGQTPAQNTPKTTPSEKPKTVIDPKATTRKLEKRIDNNMVTMTGLVEAMSNNLGQLHFLRALCFGDEDQKWREIASEMMQIEAPNDPAYRRQLIRAFNAGYYAQQERYKTCTSAVALDVAALAENGRHLATMLGDPYRER